MPVIHMHTNKRMHLMHIILLLKIIIPRDSIHLDRFLTISPQMMILRFLSTTEGVPEAMPRGVKKPPLILPMEHSREGFASAMISSATQMFDVSHP